MMNFLKKPYRFAVIFSILLTSFFTYALLDTFVIPRALTVVESQSVVAEEPDVTSLEPSLRVEEEPAVTSSELSSSAAEEFGAKSLETAESPSDDKAETVITATSYEDENIKITIETVREYDTTIYVADIQLSDASYLKTAFASNSYGRNIKDTTSDMAEANKAIFAVNGDYYGFRDSGYVLRNGVLYRNTSNGADDLVIDSDGNLSVVSENETSAKSLLEDGVWQVFSFGPALVENGEISVSEGSEVAKSKTSNPRTAIGQVSELHYIIIVSDGRTSESGGLSLLQLAEQFAERGCSVAYNLDGGGSSTMYFNGDVVNNPTNGRSDKEREVSDIVYIGYE